MADQPLTFTTLAEGLPVEIDGARYQIRHPDSLSIGAAQRIEVVRARVIALLEDSTRPESADAEISAGLAVVCRGILNAPPDVQERLSDAQRILIMRSFTTLRSALPTLIGAQAPKAANPRNGARSFRGSRASTGDRPPTGTSTSPAA